MVLFVILLAEGVGVNKVHKLMKIVYREHVLLYTHRQDQNKCFHEGDRNLEIMICDLDKVITLSSHHRIFGSLKKFLERSFFTQRESHGQCLKLVPISVK